MREMNHNEMINRAKKWLLNTRGCGFILSELTSYYNSEIPDVIGWKCGQSYLVECKVTRNDFLADKKKGFRRMQWRGMGNYRYYMTTPSLIELNEIPYRWGLLYVYPSIVKVIKKPSFIYYSTIAERERYILCSALRRVHLRNDLEKIYNFKFLYGDNNTHT